MAGLSELYDWLAPAPNTEYGSLLPLARDTRTGMGRWAMPEMVRQGLKGYLDLAQGTETGTLTPEALQTMVFGGLGAGAAMAPRGALAAGGARPSAPPIRAYHGSPHSFDRFDASKIGSGEGAQAYGHGLYFAENEGVARSYRDVLTPLKQPYYGDTPVNDFPSDVWSLLFEVMKGGKSVADYEAKKQYWINRIKSNNGDPKSLEILNNIDPKQMSLRGPDGHMYEVGIHADPAKFLDWDKPLSAQSEPVTSALQTILKDRDRAPGDWIRSSPGAEGRLSEAGIPGIRYLDQGSRSAGAGSSNYVVFPGQESIIEILRKYGLMSPAPVAMPGGNTGTPTLEQRQLMNPGLF